MYFTIFSLLTSLESHLWFLTLLIPFYAYLRIIAILYLVLPQTQGARILYQERLQPFLAHHEAQIETLIGDAHARIREYGGEWVERLIETVRERVFGARPAPKAAGAYSAASAGPGAGGYVQGLVQRFSLPSAGAPAGEFYGMLAAAAGGLGRGNAPAEDLSPAAQVEALLRQGGLVPKGVSGKEERARFLGAQKERLGALLAAVEREEGSLEEGGFGRSKSEASFERIEGEDLAYGNVPPPKGAGEGWFGGWLGGKGEEKRKEE